MVDRVVPVAIAAPDHPCQQRVALHEVAGEEERRPNLVAPQDGEHTLRAVGVAAAVEGQRDDVLPRLEPDDLARHNGRWKREHHASPGRRMPGTRARSAGTGSPSGLATTRTAP